MTGGCRICLFIITFAAGYLLLPTRADAYLDPGTGSFIFQAILGSLVVIGVTVKLFWNRILGLFGIRKTNRSYAEEHEEYRETPKQKLPNKIEGKR